MSTNVPDHVSRITLESALIELRKWKNASIKAYAVTEDEEYRAHMRLLAGELEVVAFRLEALLHPAGREDDG